MRSLLVLALLVTSAVLAQGPLRSIPPEAVRGTLSHVQDLAVLIDGKPRQLAPGAIIRDTFNRIVLPASLTSPVVAKYQTNPDGSIRLVWILSQQEALDTAPPPPPKPPAKKDEKKDEKKADEKKAPAK